VEGEGGVLTILEVLLVQVSSPIVTTSRTNTLLPGCVDQCNGCQYGGAGGGGLTGSNSYGSGQVMYASGCIINILLLLLMLILLMTGGTQTSGGTGGSAFGSGVPSPQEGQSGAYWSGGAGYGAGGGGYYGGGNYFYYDNYYYNNYYYYYYQGEVEHMPVFLQGVQADQVTSMVVSHRQLHHIMEIVDHRQHFHKPHHTYTMRFKTVEGQVMEVHQEVEQDAVE